MTLSRRDMLKMGLLGGRPVALPLERTVRADSGPVNRIAASKLPAPFTIPFTAPSALVPYRTDATTDYYKVWMKPVQGRRAARVPDAPLGLQRARSRSDRARPRRAARRWSGTSTRCRASTRRSVHAVDVGAPARFRVVAAVRRVRQRHHATRASTRTTTTRTSRPAAPSGTTTTGCTTPPRTSTWASRRSTTCTTPCEASLPIPKGAYDVPLIVSDAMFNADGSAALRQPQRVRHVRRRHPGQRRPWPTMKVQRRKYRFRLLNASISRSYKLVARARGEPLTVIATDGGFMPYPQPVSELPPQHGRAVRDRHRLREVPRRARASSCRTASPPNNIDYDQHQQGHGL